MKKSIYTKFGTLALLILTLINFTNLQAQDKADEIVGTWQMTDESAKMEVFKSGNKYKTKLLWGKDAVNKDGSSKKDINNPDEKLRNRNLVGSIMIKGLTFEDDEWNDGKVYNNANGKWYNCYVKIKKGQLHLRGYLGLPMFGQTTKWNRVK